MSELFDKEVNAQKEFEKNTEVHANFRKVMKKCAMKMNKETKKNDVAAYFCSSESIPFYYIIIYSIL